MSLSLSDQVGELERKVQELEVENARLRASLCGRRPCCPCPLPWPVWAPIYTPCDTYGNPGGTYTSDNTAAVTLT